jgi:hypothetical protein
VQHALHVPAIGVLPLAVPQDNDPHLRFPPTTRKSRGGESPIAHQLVARFPQKSSLIANLTVRRARSLVRNAERTIVQMQHEGWRREC